MTTVIRVIVLRTPLAGVPLSETHPGPGAPNDRWGLMTGKPLRCGGRVSSRRGRWADTDGYKIDWFMNYDFRIDDRRIFNKIRGEREREREFVNDWKCTEVNTSERLNVFAVYE